MRNHRMNLKMAAAISIAGLGLLVAASGASAGNGSTTRVAALSSLNNSGVSGTASAEVTHNRLHVAYDAADALPNAVHAVHIHFGKTAAHECPTQAADGGDGQLTTGEGLPFYGPVAVSLTNTGDTSPASVLALDRYSDAPDGTLTYDRSGIKTKGSVAKAIADGQGVVVIHGVDYNDNGVYDFDAGTSDLDPSLPAEATDLAACGVLR